MFRVPVDTEEVRTPYNYDLIKYLFFKKLYTNRSELSLWSNLTISRYTTI